MLDLRACRRSAPRTAFAALTAKSQATILSETVSALAAAEGSAPKRQDVRRDFENGGPLARNYWGGFLRRFDPDVALEHSRWRMGAIETNRAEILLTHEGAERPAVLRMYREGGIWKVGLAETFWTR